MIEYSNTLGGQANDFLPNSDQEEVQESADSIRQNSDVSDESWLLGSVMRLLILMDLKACLQSLELLGSTSTSAIDPERLAIDEADDEMDKWTPIRSTGACCSSGLETGENALCCIGIIGFGDEQGVIHFASSSRNA